MTKDKTVERLTRWAERGTPGTKPIPAATVVLVRDGCDGGIEALMLRRNSKIAFGGMWVFPGGRVDDADRDGIAANDDLAAARRAAVREAAEEAGLILDESALIPISHWTPPAVTPKRFLTWFFLAAAPDCEVAIDDGEIKAHEWMCPRAALERRDAKEIELAPPTWVTLNKLLPHADVAAALAAVRAAPAEIFETRIALLDGAPTALWQGDAGWEKSVAEATGARHRLVMSDAPWRYERSR
jgi:8-oxo-dGTP pyrophosphatase MutT (NUDIX family)